MLGSREDLRWVQRDAGTEDGPAEAGNARRDPAAARSRRPTQRHTQVAVPPARPPPPHRLRHFHHPQTLSHCHRSSRSSRNPSPRSVLAPPSVAGVQLVDDRCSCSCCPSCASRCTLFDARTVPNARGVLTRCVARRAVVVVAEAVSHGWND